MVASHFSLHMLYNWRALWKMVYVTFWSSKFCKLISLKMQIYVGVHQNIIFLIPLPTFQCCQSMLQGFSQSLNPFTIFIPNSLTFWCSVQSTLSVEGEGGVSAIVCPILYWLWTVEQIISRSHIFAFFPPNSSITNKYLASL